MMKLRHDHAILVLTLALLVIGLGIVFSASHELARARFGDSFLLVKRQLLHAGFGMLLLLLASQWDYRFWQRHARLLLLGSGVLLAVVLFFNAVRGSRSWLPGLGQPVEVARLALIFYLASELERLGERRLGSLRHGFLPLVGVIGIVLLLVLKQPDFGSAMALCLISLTMLFVGGVRLAHLFGSGALLLSGAVLMAVHRPHVRARILGFLHPDANAMGGAYQSLQSVMSIGSGGLFGKGLGQGMAKYGYLPDPHTDFVFSVLGEELGFVGCAVVLLLFLLLVARAVRVARALENERFATLLAIGIGASLFWYVAVNVLVAIRFFPVTGLPLPLVSYGGSALVSHLFAIGVLRSLARRAEPLRPRRCRWPEPQECALEGAL